MSLILNSVNCKIKGKALNDLLYNILMQDEPWETNNFISLRGINLKDLQPFCIYEGWKEIDHEIIITMKNKIPENAEEWEFLGQR